MNIINWLFGVKDIKPLVVDLDHDDKPVPRVTWNDNSGGIFTPRPPRLPDPEPPMVLQAFTYEDLKTFRLFSQPYIVRANYDVVQQALEDGVLKRHEKEYKEYLEWVRKNI